MFQFVASYNMKFGLRNLYFPDIDVSHVSDEGAPVDCLKYM